MRTVIILSLPLFRPSSSRFVASPSPVAFSDSALPPPLSPPRPLFLSCPLLLPLASYDVGCPNVIVKHKLPQIRPSVYLFDNSTSDLRLPTSRPRGCHQYCCCCYRNTCTTDVSFFPLAARAEIPTTMRTHLPRCPPAVDSDRYIRVRVLTIRSQSPSPQVSPFLPLYVLVVYGARCRVYDTYHRALC
ncbi:hypothetical protein C8Q77DRAFT_671451 [Trametes polyzona]|nr:hypothetical protein C8Q77DRAFT_671451 [Trametes polyzona]